MPDQILARADHSKPIPREGLEQLADARVSAASLNLDPWTLAVEIAELLSAGCTKTHLRALVGAGHLQHAEDITRRSDPIRTFRPECPMKFGPHTCFVLTESGLNCVETLHPRVAAENETLRHDPPHALAASVSSRIPVWDPQTREFSVGKQLLKRFTRPAPILDIVLSSFQELDWPLRLDDPLPPVRDIVSAERLRDTVRRLNRCQNPHTVRFSSDGLGTGVRWSWGTNPTNHG